MSKNALAEQVAHLQTQLSQMQQMAALGELVGTTTHEFNNYLMTIINYAKLGMRQTDEASRNRAFQKIFDAGQRAAQVTSVILGSARNRSSQLEPTQLSTIIEQAMVLLEREMRKYQIGVELNLPEVPKVLANGSQIQQVLINLLINSRQAIGSGGSITISLVEDTKQDAIDLKILDDGPGMPPDVLTRIFEPQFSTKSGPDESGKGGSGFGLYNCRQIIEAHQGKIRVDSSVGKGTCFTLKLRKAPAPSAISSPRTGQASPSHTESVTQV
jgi:signal transduction histidine kinase